MPDRLGWICPRCFTAVSPDCTGCAACSPAPAWTGPFKPDESGAVFAPMRADLTATPRQVASLQAALRAAAGGMLSVEIVVLPPGSKVMVPANAPGPVPADPVPNAESAPPRRWEYPVGGPRCPGCTPPGENDGPARCPECHMPLTMHHEPGCSRPCGPCEERRLKDAEETRLTVRLPPLMGRPGYRQVSRLVGEWSEVFTGLQARLADKGMVQADVDFRLTPQDGQARD